MIPAIARLLFNLSLIIGTGLAVWLTLFVILRTIRFLIEWTGYEVQDFTSWMLSPLFAWNERRKAAKNAETIHKLVERNRSRTKRH